MTRREWLTANPPPRPGKSIQQLLDPLNAQNAKRAELVTLRQRWEPTAVRGRASWGLTRRER